MAKAKSRNSSDNDLLAALPDKDRQAITSRFTKIALSLKDIVYSPDKPITDVYFPISGVVSLVSEVGDDIVEIATVGKEGFVGLPVYLGSDTTSVKAFSQIPGEGFRMDTEAFRTAVKNSEALNNLMRHYTQALLNQIAQSVACNRAHSIEQRCARWLLMTHDRVPGDEFELTQEFLGQMLGVRRPQVSTVASRLQKRRLIRYSRGHVTIVNRKRLESVTCECYEIVRKEYERLLPNDRASAKQVR